MNADESIDTLTDGAVSANVLIDSLNDALLDADTWADSCRLAEDSSWCIWAGQSDDGLKHAFPGDEEPPFPWENSSDTRIRLVDEKVREHCLVAMLAAKRGNWQFTGTEGMDFIEAKRRSQLLRWQEAKHIPAARRERNLFIYWAALYGCSVMGLGWEEREKIGLQRVTTDDLIQAFLAHYGVQPDAEGQMPEEAAAVLENLQYILSDPKESLDWLELWLGEFFPTASKKLLKKGAKELRDEGETELPKLRTVASRPKWQAMKPFEHVFFPVDTESMATARWVATRRGMSKPEIEDQREAWGDAFCDELLKQEGKWSTIGLDNYRGAGNHGRTRWSGGQRRGAFVENANTKGQYEVFYFYHESVDENGVCGLYRTVCSPHVRDHNGYMTAEQEIYDDGSGTMPFEEYTIWDDQRALLKCEGIPAWIYTHQQEKKSQRDARINVTSLSVLPPIRRHARDKNLPIILGPDMPIYESVPGSTTWMEPPTNRTAMATDIERTVDREANRFTGSYDPEVPDAVVGMHQEFNVDQFTEAYDRVLRRTYQLDQCYLDEVTVTRVTGATGQPFKVSREEIQGDFDVQITFDPRELNLDFAMKKFEAAAKVAKDIDINRVTDTNMLVKMGYSIIDPAWADMLVQDERVADEREIRETRNAINDIIAGQQPVMEEGINSRLRMGYFEKEMQTNPVLLQIQANPDDPRNETLAMYQQHLQHMDHQQNIAPTEGRLGVKVGQ